MLMCNIIILNYFWSRKKKINVYFLAWDVTKLCIYSIAARACHLITKSAVNPPAVIPPLAIVDKTWISHRLNLTRATDQRLPHWDFLITNVSKTYKRHSGRKIVVKGVYIYIYKGFTLPRFTDSYITKHPSFLIPFCGCKR